MKRTVKYRDRDRELEIKMTPMIDVVFLLLVFFVWTASFTIVENSLNTNVTAELGESPSENQEPPPELDFDQVVVRVFQDTELRWTVNEVPVASLVDLDRKLVQMAAIKSDVALIIHPASGVLLGDVIAVFDLANLAGFSKVQFATSTVLTP